VLTAAIGPPAIVPIIGYDNGSRTRSIDLADAAGSTNMMVPERDAERSRTASDGREMADNPTISPHPPRRPTSSDEAAGRSRKRLEAPARERRGDRRLKYARVVVSTSAARRRTSGSQSGRRSASLGPARHNGPQRSAAAGLHQSRAEKCPFVRTELRQRAQRSAGVQSSASPIRIRVSVSSGAPSRSRVSQPG